jgi:hypothetical protein
MLDLDNPLVVLSLLLSFVSVERTYETLASMCWGIRVKNPDIKNLS